MSLAYYPFYADRYEADTAHLTLLEDGAYNRLLRLCWRSPGCKMPDDRTWIHRQMRAATPTEKAAVDRVLAEFFRRGKGKIWNPKLLEVHAQVSEAHLNKSEAGKRGAVAKALKKAENASSNAKAALKQPEPEPEPERIGGGVGAREAPQTDREAILVAIGVDPVSGITGPSGRMLGTQADMAEVARWLELPGITVPIILTEVRRIMGGKRDGPPSTFRFFTAAIQRLSGEISRPALEPTAPTGPAGGRHDRQRFDRTIDALADGLSSGQVSLGIEDRDPFA
jgi:uncharacterized protein YdaU (DUF1376 family)